MLICFENQSQFLIFIYPGLTNVIFKMIQKLILWMILRTRTVILRKMIIQIMILWTIMVSIWNLKCLPTRRSTNKNYGNNFITIMSFQSLLPKLHIPPNFASECRISCQSKIGGTMHTALKVLLSIGNRRNHAYRSKSE